MLTDTQTGEIFRQRCPRTIPNKVEDVINEWRIFYCFLFLPLGTNYKKATNVTFTSRHVIRHVTDETKKFSLEIVLHDGQFGVRKWGSKKHNN